MTMTLAMIYEVDTQAISSSVAPRFPIMWGIATLTIDVSISSSIAAIVTVAAMMHLWAYLSSTDVEMPDDCSTAVLTAKYPRERRLKALDAADDCRRTAWSLRYERARAARL